MRTFVFIFFLSTYLFAVRVYIIRINYKYNNITRTHERVLFSVSNDRSSQREFFIVVPRQGRIYNIINASDDISIRIRRTRTTIIIVVHAYYRYILSDLSTRHDNSVNVVWFFDFYYNNITHAMEGKRRENACKTDYMGRRIKI